MHTAIRTAAFIAAAPFLGMSPSVSAQSPAGTWVTEVPTRVEVVNGEHIGSNPVKVTITLEQKGDSVIGTWQRGPMEGMPDAAPRRLMGVLRDGQLTLKTEPATAKIKRNDDEGYDIQMVTTYVLTLEGDVLKGNESATSTDGSIQSSERAFSAKRVKT